MKRGKTFRFISEISMKPIRCDKCGNVIELGLGYNCIRETGMCEKCVLKK